MCGPAGVHVPEDGDVWRTLTDLEPLQLLFGAGVEDVGGLGLGGGPLGAPQPVFKARLVVQELGPETPRLLDPGDTRDA